MDEAYRQRIESLWIDIKRAQTHPHACQETVRKCCDSMNEYHGPREIPRADQIKFCGANSQKLRFVVTCGGVSYPLH